jgi:cytochrome P450
VGWELKYFRKISEYENEEDGPNAPALPVFDINVFGVDSNFKRAKRELTRRLYIIGFAILRWCWPVLRIGRAVVVSRHDDVVEVLERRDDFQVPYGPEMRKITGGRDFALGIDGKKHDEQRARIMAAVTQKADAERVVRRTREVTENLIKGSGGRIDVMRDLLARVMMEACDEYFGLDLEEPNAFLDRTFANSALLFADPMGDLDWRRNTLSGAVYNRHVVDEAIERAVQAVKRGTDVPDTILTRLVRQYVDKGEPIDRLEIRAMAIGTITGLVPTNTLGAAKMLEELKRRFGVFEDAKEIARRWKETTDETERKACRTAFKDILWEVSRLSPGLQPGQWRYAPRDTTLNGKRIKGGSVLMVATMSALRDPRHFGAQAGTYVSDRGYGKERPRLMFGAASHECLGPTWRWSRSPKCSSSCSRRRTCAGRRARRAGWAISARSRAASTWSSTPRSPCRIRAWSALRSG